MAQSIYGQYGSMVFNDQVMKEKLPTPVYQELARTIKEHRPLNTELANAVADAMKAWALDKGATHFTHWFQPLTGITSEKHDSFLSPQPDGTVILSFSGKELIHGEPDASSFPSGGLRASFEARGYTAWDPTSYAFIKDGVLCIPTAFVSYTGDALDKKTPLLRSMDAISLQIRRVLALFGKKPANVTVTVGHEQEYFLIKEEDYQKRLDLLLTGRTLFGIDPCKGQELEDHYFGAIRPTVNRFMKELDEELWKLGIPANTEHNEVAPSQHELATIYLPANVSVDANLLAMEQMRKLASHHGLVCLLHEQPFAGINGSGKHNNWSLSIDGANLFDPGSTPEENLQFLLFLTAIIKAVDEYQGLLRLSVATASNDLRLGANEAPPAVVSIFLGDELEALVRSIIDATPYETNGEKTMDLGSRVLPRLIIDNTDRNRTSPFAFTGNKFEFRMPGSQINLSDANMVLNTIVASALADCADALEGSEDFNADARAYMKQVLTNHQRIIFNGDNYTDEWVDEAKERGLLNLASTPEALPQCVEPKNVELFEKFGILSALELASRYEVSLENYSKKINIEAQVTARMARARFIPALVDFSSNVAASLVVKKTANEASELPAEKALLDKLNAGLNAITTGVETLDVALSKAQSCKEAQEKADTYHAEVIPAMNAVRAAVDEMEMIVGHDYWPVPSYNHMLFYT
ncbi:MAG: glutamine synthetase III [Coriobacteriales bacterium]|jgi:glutamine synthetase|nr:glutamine synthetase III [Coriobacteriales bacterium]